MLLQTRWASELNPLLRAPLAQAVRLSGIVLVVGDNVINHRLPDKLRGWLITDITGASSIYRSASKNDKTLTLNSSAAVTVDILVF
jgi:hypothetical protein